MKRNYPRIEIDDLTAVIRESIAAQRNDDKQTGALYLHPRRTVTHHRKFRTQTTTRFSTTLRPSISHQRTVAISRPHFRAERYRAVLKRSPDEAEFLRDLKRLRVAGSTRSICSRRYGSPRRQSQKSPARRIAFPALIRRMGQLPLLATLFVSQSHSYDFRTWFAINVSSLVTCCRSTSRLPILSIVFRPRGRVPPGVSFRRRLVKAIAADGHRTTGTAPATTCVGNQNIAPLWRDQQQGAAGHERLEKEIAMRKGDFENRSGTRLARIRNHGSKKMRSNTERK